MAITSKHAKVSGKSDGLDTTLVQPSDWNAGHEIKCDQDKILGRVSVGNGLIEEISCTTYARTLLAAASAAAAWALIKQTILLTDIDVVGGTGLAAPAVDDSIALYDLSATANRKMALSDLFRVITLLTAKATPVAADEVLIYDVAGTAPKKATITSIAATAAFKPPTRTILLSGAGTYTTPAGCKALFIQMCGAGGSSNSGGNGNDTSFNSIVAAGGVTGSGAQGGAGGTGGAGSATFRQKGGDGACGADGNGSSGQGGTNCFSGNGRNRNNSTGAIATDAGANTGAGACYNGTDQGGGGAGEYVEIDIASPAASYSYAVGAVGSVGAGSKAAGSGVIKIWEHY